MGVLELILLIVGVLVGAAVLFASFARTYVFTVYLSGNRKQASNGLTGEQAAQALLNQLDIKDVSVRKLGFFQAVLYGNHYNPRKKTIFLRRNILNKSTVTANALAVQKVGLVIQDRNNDKAFKIKAKLQPFIVLAPILFVPLVLVGVAIDIALTSNIGIFSVILGSSAFLFLLLSLIFTLVTIKAENKANKTAVEIIEQTNLLEDSEQKRVKRIYKAYLVSYVADFIMSVLYLLRYILRIATRFKGKGFRRR